MKQNTLKYILISSGIVIIFFLNTSDIFARKKKFNFGIGLRAGDPSGLSFKYFYSDDVNYEINLGRTGLLATNYYYDSFRRLDRFKDCECDYISHKVADSYSIQGHYLFMVPFPDVEKLFWYYGAGGQFRYITVEYDYKEKFYKENNTFQWEKQSYTLYTYDFGIDGVAGMEYSLQGIPVTIFVDIDLFLELVDNPFIMRGQVGIGGRYNFYQ